MCFNNHSTTNQEKQIQSIVPLSVTKDRMIRVKIRHNSPSAVGKILRFDESIEIDALIRKVAQKLGVNEHSEKYELRIGGEIVLEETSEIEDGDDLVLMTTDGCSKDERKPAAVVKQKDGYATDSDNESDEVGDDQNSDSLENDEEEQLLDSMTSEDDNGIYPSAVAVPIDALDVEAVAQPILVLPSSSRSFSSASSIRQSTNNSGSNNVSSMACFEIAGSGDTVTPHCFSNEMEGYLRNGRGPESSVMISRSMIGVVGLLCFLLYLTNMFMCRLSDSDRQFCLPCE